MSDAETDPQPSDPETPDERSIEPVSYDCTPWAGESRRILQSLLKGKEIPHAWEGTVVVVPAVFADDLRDLTDEVEALAVRTLDPDVPQIAFEVAAWSNEEQNKLVNSLDGAGIAHEWDSDGDLVVAEDSEEQVEMLIDAILEQAEDSDGGSELDGIELHEILGGIFDSASRLAKDPEDYRRRSDVLAGAARIVGVGTPFGYDDSTWESIRTAVGALVGSIEGEEGEGEPADESPGITESAETVRDLIRPLV